MKQLEKDMLVYCWSLFCCSQGSDVSTLVGCFEGGEPIRQDQCPGGRKDDTGKVVDGDDDVVFADDNRNDVDRLKKQRTALE